MSQSSEIWADSMTTEQESTGVLADTTVAAKKGKGGDLIIPCQV
jgi:hypothetical protein